MIDPVNLAGDVIAAGAALAGLLLVYIGSVATSFGGFEKAQQASVKGAHQLRAWLGFVGFMFALVASGLGIIGKWLNHGPTSAAAVIFLALTLLWVAGAALQTTRDIR